MLRAGARNGSPSRGRGSIDQELIDQRALHEITNFFLEKSKDEGNAARGANARLIVLAVGRFRLTMKKDRHT
jgi:hypothetical protein